MPRVRRKYEELSIWLGAYMRREQKAGRVLGNKKKRNRIHALRKTHNFIPGYGIITIPTEQLLERVEVQESDLLSDTGDSGSDEG